VPWLAVPLALAIGLTATGCSLFPGSADQGGGRPASSTRYPTPLPSATSPGQTGAAVWVLTSVGVNVRSKPDQTADKVATLGQGAKLLVQTSQKKGSQTWLHVKSTSGQTDGWVLDDPQLVIHREVKEYDDPQSAYTFLYPAGWTSQPGNPVTFTAPTGDPAGGALMVQYADDATKLPPVPLSPGKESPQNEPSKPVEVYGVTAFVAVYQTTSGGWEYVVEKKIGSRAFLFDFKHPNATQPDVSLFVQLLSSVIVSG
jgi:Bacterial SH3 domain